MEQLLVLRGGLRRQSSFTQMRSDALRCNQRTCDLDTSARTA